MLTQLYCALMFALVSPSTSDGIWLHVAPGVRAFVAPTNCSFGDDIVALNGERQAIQPLHSEGHEERKKQSRRARNDGQSEVEDAKVRAARAHLPRPGRVVIGAVTRVLRSGELRMSLREHDITAAEAGKYLNGTIKLLQGEKEGGEGKGGSRGVGIGEQFRWNRFLPGRVVVGEMEENPSSARHLNLTVGLEQGTVYGRVDVTQLMDIKVYMLAMKVSLE